MVWGQSWDTCGQGPKPPAGAHVPTLPTICLPPRGTPGVFVHVWVQRPGKQTIVGRQAVLWGVMACALEVELGSSRGLQEEGRGFLQPPGPAAHALSDSGGTEAFSLTASRCSATDFRVWPGAGCAATPCPAPCPGGRGPVSCSHHHGWRTVTHRTASPFTCPPLLGAALASRPVRCAHFHP